MITAEEKQDYQTRLYMIKGMLTDATKAEQVEFKALVEKFKTDMRGNDMMQLAVDVASIEIALEEG